LLQGAVYLAAVRLVWRPPSSRRIVLGIAAIAAIMRIPVALAPPYLSTDAYRYVWDGRVTAAGINPYRYVPADPHLAALRDPDIFPNINRADSAVTIYPPFAEAIFLTVTRASESVTAMKAAMVGFEVITFVLLVDLLSREGLPTGRVAVYAWHPLPLWEFAGSGHIDAALIALAVAALWAARRGQSGLTGLFLAGATLTKLYPAVLLPALYRRRGWAMPVAFAAAIVMGYLPFIGVGWKVFGFLPGYAGEEGFDAGGTGFYLLSLIHRLPGLAGLSGRTYATGSLAILAAFGIAIMGSRDTADRAFVSAALLATIFIVLVSPHYPWYFAWLIVFACFIRSLALLWLTIACLLLYLVPVGSTSCGTITGSRLNR
jgi:alpha-1,6-mannosyltransferase